MIKGEFVGRKLESAVLAFEIVAEENIHASKFNVQGNFMILKKPKDLGEAISSRDGPDEFILINVHDLGPIREKEYHGLLPIYDLNRKIVAV